MKKHVFLWGMLFSILIIPKNVWSQNDLEGQPVGSWSIGYSVWDELLPEGDYYSPLTILGNYLLWTHHRLKLYAESQLTKVSSPLRARTNYEFGLNLGFSFDFIHTRKLSMNAAIGAGPHYITINTGLQARGFIFSDNFEIGAAYNLFDINTVVLLKMRFRHISNAGLNEPNGGIDNLFIIGGFGIKF